MKFINQLALGALVITMATACNESDSKAEENTVADEAAVSTLDAVNSVDDANKASDPTVALVKKESEPLETIKKRKITSGWKQGTVKYMDLEGGFYGIFTESGGKYLPLNMDKEFRSNGAIIQFKGKVQHNMNTIQQWGTPIKLSEVKLIKAGNNVDPSLM